MLGDLKKSHQFLVVFIFLLLLTLLIYGFVLFKNYSPNKGNKYEPKENEIVYKNYVYTLPKYWYDNEEYSKTYPDLLSIYYIFQADDKAYNRMGAIIDVKRISSNYKKENIFQSIDFALDQLKNSKFKGKIGDGKVVDYDNSSVVLFPCEVGESSKVIFAFMSAYDDYYYMIQFYPKTKNDGGEEIIYDEEDLFIVVDFLKTGKKI